MDRQRLVASVARPVLLETAVTLSQCMCKHRVGLLLPTLAMRALGALVSAVHLAETVLDPHLSINYLAVG